MQMLLINFAGGGIKYFRVVQIFQEKVDGDHFLGGPNILLQAFSAGKQNNSCTIQHRNTTAEW